MPWAGVASYNTNPALNTTINDVDIAELCAAAGFNNALRQIMADIASWVATQQITLPVAIANGGTGATTAPNALTALGALAATFRDIVPISKSGAFTLADSERGQSLRYSGAAAAATINPNSTTPITTGAAYVIRNTGTGAITVTRGAGVNLYVNGGTTSANASIAIGGVATLINWAADDWTINGTGVS